ncbi:MAG TPA: hypothetical protein VIJ15_12860 [Dermatophilaceae bacterium]
MSRTAAGTYTDAADFAHPVKPVPTSTAQDDGGFADYAAAVVIERRSPRQPGLFGGPGSGNFHSRRYDDPANYLG